MAGLGNRRATDMRSRNIKPSFFLNEDLAECGEAAMLLFCGLWCMADKDGKLEDRPARIKAAIMPYFNHDCNDLLNRLMDKGFVYRYEVENKRYLLIPKFKQHQHPHHRESDSVIPYPAKGYEMPEASLGLASGLSGESPIPARLIPDSLLLIPDSPIPSDGGLSPGNSIPIELKTEEFKAAWSNWEKHRAEMGRALTPTSRAEQLKQCAEWGSKRSVDAIRNSILHSWKILVDPERPNNGQKRDETVEEKIKRMLASGEIK